VRLWVALGFACGVPLLGALWLVVRLAWLQRAYRREYERRRDDSAGDGVQ
jgi:hypothetical protein